MLIKTLPPQLPAGYQKTYLSREMSRAWGMDNPIGDPSGGAAYGEKNGPAVALALPIFGMTATYGAMMAGSIMAGVAFAGSALSLVGTITGNQKLTRVGAVAGLIGGAGMAGMFGDAAASATWGSTFGDAAGSATGAMSSSAEALSQTPNVTPGAETVQVTPVADTTPLVDMTSNAGASYAGGGLNAPAAPMNAVDPAGAASPLSMSAPSNASYDLLSGGGPSFAPSSEYALTGSGMSTTGINPGANSAQGIKASGDALYSAGGKTGQGFGQGFLQFAKDNPLVTMMGLQSLGGMADWLSGKTDAEMAALEAQVGFADARALQIQEEIAKERQRRTNLNTGYQQVNAGINVNPNVSIPLPWQQQQQAGLISGARTA